MSLMDYSKNFIHFEKIVAELVVYRFELLFSDKDYNVLFEPTYDYNKNLCISYIKTENEVMKTTMETILRKSINDCLQSMHMYKSINQYSQEDFKRVQNNRLHLELMLNILDFVKAATTLNKLQYIIDTNESTCID